MSPLVATCVGLLAGLAAATWWWNRIFRRQQCTVREQGEKIDELRALADRATRAGEAAAAAYLKTLPPWISMATIAELADVDEPVRRFILERAAADLEALVQEHTR